MTIDVEKKVNRECRFCGSPLEQRFIDVVLPEEDKLLKTADVRSISTFVCSECFLVQTENLTTKSDQEHVYASRFSSSWLQDMNQYINRIFKRFEMTNQDLVAELASHQNSLENSEQSNFHFGNSGLQALIDMHGKADLLICGDELAFVSDINDFISAVKLFLKPTGIVTMEFLHLLPLMEGNPFDVPVTTRFTYFSFTTIDRILKHHGLTIFDAECTPKGLIKIYAKHPENLSKRISNNTPLLRGRERDKGMSSLSYYSDFQKKIQPEKTAA